MALHAFLAMPFGVRDSGPDVAIDFEAHCTAGNALLSLQTYQLALEQFDGAFTPHAE